MFKVFALAAFAALTAAPALADFVAISDRELKITPDGQINGSALGWDVTGTWAWEDGYFCREIDWSGKPIPYNCQLVEVQDNAKIRFTVDKGAGDEATFNLR
jgi:hypothetical protein